MPEYVERTDWVLAIDHVGWWWIAPVNHLCSEVQKHISPIAAHLLQAQKIDRYPGYVQSPSMTYSLSIVNVDLYCALNGTSAYEYSR